MTIEKKSNRSQLFVPDVLGDEYAEWVSAPPDPSTAFVVEYMVHLAKEGDGEFIVQPEWAGYQDHLYVQGIQLRAQNGSKPFGLRYRAHLGGTGDTPWYYLPSGGTAVGPFCGTRGQSRQLQAIWIEVTGIAADDLDVYYSASLHQTGPTGWLRNGQMCGTIGESRAMHSIRIFVAERPVVSR